MKLYFMGLVALSAFSAFGSVDEKKCVIANNGAAEVCVGDFVSDIRHYSLDEQLDDLNLPAGEYYSGKFPKQVCSIPRGDYLVIGERSECENGTASQHIYPWSIAVEKANCSKDETAEEAYPLCNKIIDRPDRDSFYFADFTGWVTGRLWSVFEYKTNEGTFELYSINGIPYDARIVEAMNR